MSISKIRSKIEQLNWVRRDSTGGTVEENKRTNLPEILAPYIAEVSALEIPARFSRDIENKEFALRAATEVICRWQRANGIVAMTF